jgi:integrase
MLRYIIPMLILTGARKREVLAARWEDFNFECRLLCAFTRPSHEVRLGAKRV